MAAAACSRSGNTCLSLPILTISTSLPRMHLRLICSISRPIPRKLTNRKNYLRKKLLKSLTKPHYPNSLILESPRTNPEIPIELEPEQSWSFTSEQFSGGSCPAVVGEELEELDIDDSREAEIQESVKIMDGSIGKVSKNLVFKYGFWLVGAFVVQTICAVWVFGSAKFEDKRGNFMINEDKNAVLEVGLNGKGNSKVKFLLNAKMGLENGGVVYVDEDEMEKKIEEIRVMAREARERERLEMRRNGFESEDSDKEAGDEFGKSGIEKEVNDRLVKLRKRLEIARGTLSPVGSVDYVKKDGESEKNSLGGKEDNAALMFKKKYRFRGLSSKPSDKPKGFTGLYDRGDGKEVTNSKDGGNEVLMNGDIVDLKNGVESRKSNVWEKPALSNERDVLNKNGNLKDGGTEENHSATEIGQNISESESNCWWLSLPYVLVILMRRGLDDAGPFTLRSSSDAKSNLSHVVAFQDRGDATNFCYLLQSFFEDLEDFSAEIVPLSITELKEAVKSHTLKVIVVKKGELKLYAGQPLPEVEMTLRSLVAQS